MAPRNISNWNENYRRYNFRAFADTFVNFTTLQSIHVHKQMDAHYSKYSTCDRDELLYLGKISDHVTTLTVGLRHYIEEKRFDVVIQRLVVQEQLCKQAQVLTVNLQHAHTPSDATDTNTKQTH